MERSDLNRREFIRYSALVIGGAALPGGCAGTRGHQGQDGKDGALRMPCGHDRIGLGGHYFLSPFGAVLPCEVTTLWHFVQSCLPAWRAPGIRSLASCVWQS